MRKPELARAWHLATGLVSLAALLTQLIMTLRGIGVLVDETGRPAADLPVRVLRFLSYFTVQSNILVIVATLLLARDPQRDGPVFRVVRIAGLIGITVTFVVYLVALRPILDLDGLLALCDSAVHIVTPILAVVGWLLFGPWPRFTRSVLLWSLVWPAAYFAYSLVHGAISGWYPYPFVDVVKIGYGTAARNVVLVVLLLLAVGGMFVWLDGVLSRRGADQLARPPSAAR